MNKNLESIAKWLTISVGTFIASGFFAVYTFMSRFHLRDHGAEFLKWKYVYVGTLCWLFPIALLLPIWGLYSLQKALEQKAAQEAARKYKPGTIVRYGLMQVVESFIVPFRAEDGSGADAQKAKEDVDILSVLLVTVVPFVIYLTVEFARPGINLPLTCFATVFITFLLLSLLDILGLSQSVRRITRLVCAFGAFLTLSLCGLRLFLFSWRILVSGGAVYVLLTLSSAVILIRTLQFGKTEQDAAKPFGQVTGFSLSFLLMIVGVLSYGAFIYPYIPASRGGGDFTVLSDTLVQLKESAVACPLNNPHQAANCREAFAAMHFKVIDSTETSLFLADTATAGGPCSWREFPTTLSEEINVPTVYEINRNEIAAMVYATPLQHDCAEYSDAELRWILGRCELVGGILRNFTYKTVRVAKRIRSW